MSRRRKKSVPPALGARYEVLPPADAGEPVYKGPVPPAKTIVHAVAVGNFELVDAGQPLSPEEARAWRAARGLPEANRSLVPTAEEVARLPRLARQAFAVRCAARVQPLLAAPIA